MKRIVLFCTVLMAVFVSRGQYTLTGSVSDAYSTEKLPFAKITVKGKNTGFITDEQGLFSLEVNGSDTLLVNLLGYETQTISVNNRKQIDIEMTPENRTLNPQVVTALGLKRNKRDLGYSVQKLDPREITEVRSTNIVNTFAGRIAGVQTTNGSSGVGSSSRIIIRGETSLSGNNQPLFVVDGVPVSNDFIPNNTENLENDFHEVDYGNGIGDFSPDDIKSLTVLKGPGAAALYGSRAANGVVVIETKDGSTNKGFSVAVNSQVTFEQIAFLPEFQDVYGQGSGGVFAYEDGLGGGVGDGGLVSFGPKMEGQLITQFDGPSTDLNGNVVRGGDVIARGGNSITPTAWNANPDNVRSFFKTGVTSQQHIAISSGKEKSNYRFSFTRMDNTGTIPNTDYTRNNVAMTATQQINKKLKLRTYVNYINSSSNHRPGLGYGSENVMYSFLWMGRQVNLENAEDYWQAGQENFQQYNYNTQWLDNPYFNVFENTNAFDKNRLLGNAALTYTITDNLNLRLRSGIDTYHDLRTSKRAFSTQRFKNGAYREDEIDFTEINTDALLTYQNKIGEDLNWNIGIGANNFTQRSNYKSTVAGELSVPGIYNFGNSKIPLNSSQYKAQKQINSLYGILGVNYKRFLYLDANIRNDWSTTLPSENNSFAYYSTSLAFVLSEVVDLPEFMTYAKARISSSSVGNDTQPYQLANTYAFNQNYGSYPLLTNSATLLNANLRPERINGLEGGIELYFFKDKVGLDVTVYQNTALDQIIGVPASAASGYTNRIVNGGEIQSGESK